MIHCTKQLKVRNKVFFYHLFSSNDQEGHSAQTFFKRDDVVNQCHKFSSAFLSYFSRESKVSLFF